MLDVPECLKICGPCTKRDRTTCAADGSPLISHASRSYCPLGKFPGEIPDDFDPAQEIRRMKSGGCCGKPAAPE